MAEGTWGRTKRRKLPLRNIRLFKTYEKTYAVRGAKDASVWIKRISNNKIGDKILTFIQSKIDGLLHFAIFFFLPLVSTMSPTHCIVPLILSVFLYSDESILNRFLLKVILTKSWNRLLHDIMCKRTLNFSL